MTHWDLKHLIYQSQVPYHISTKFWWKRKMHRHQKWLHMTRRRSKMSLETVLLHKIVLQIMWQKKQPSDFVFTRHLICTIYINLISYMQYIQITSWHSDDSFYKWKHCRKPCTSRASESWARFAWYSWARFAYWSIKKRTTSIVTQPTGKKRKNGASQFDFCTALIKMFTEQWLSSVWKWVKFRDESDENIHPNLWT